MAKQCGGGLSLPRVFFICVIAPVNRQHLAFGGAALFYSGLQQVIIAAAQRLVFDFIGVGGVHHREWKNKHKACAHECLIFTAFIQVGFQRDNVVL